MLGCAERRHAGGTNTPGAESVPSTSDLEVSDHREKETLRFAVLGDIGTGDVEQAAIGKAMHTVCTELGSCDFVLVTGDNIYGTALDRTARDPVRELYRKIFEDAYLDFGRTDFWLVLGNHDWHRRNMPASQIDYSSMSERWRMPSTDYAVPHLPEWIAIYGIDSTLLVKGRRNGQVSRARDTLCTARSWKILFGHHPVYTVSRHGGANATLEKVEEALVGPLIRRCRVDLYLAGHDHLQAHLETPDFHQITQGAGGAHLYGLRSSMRFPREARVEVCTAKSVYGFAILEATNETLAVTFYELVGETAEPFHGHVLNRVNRTE